MGVRGADFHAVLNTYITFDSQKLDNHPLISMRDWFQDPQWTPKSADAQVPNTKMP